MSRDIDPRSHEQERPTVDRGSRGGGNTKERSTSEVRDVFARDLELPRGAERARVWAGGKALELSGSEVRVLSTVGAFRVVPASDLTDRSCLNQRTVADDLRHLSDTGLVKTMPYVVGKTRTALVSLTDRGRALLEDSRRPGHGTPQEFRAGFVKPRELAHDSRLYQAYLRSAERIVSRGGYIRRAVLDYELKRDYQRFLNDPCRVRADRKRHSAADADDVARWAQEHHLSMVDGHVQFPDVRIEFDDRDGRSTVEDVEVMTPHYRGAQRAAKGQAGFTCYRSSGVRIGGGSRGGRGGHGFDPRVAEEMLE